MAESGEVQWRNARIVSGEDWSPRMVTLSNLLTWKRSIKGSTQAIGASGRGTGRLVGTKGYMDCIAIARLSFESGRLRRSS